MSLLTTKRSVVVPSSHAPKTGSTCLAVTRKDTGVARKGGSRRAMAEFAPRLDTYVQLHAACKRMLDGGSTISDALVHDFDEAAAWVAVQAPDVYAMFNGEMGDPEEAAPRERE